MAQRYEGFYAPRELVAHGRAKVYSGLAARAANDDERCEALTFNSNLNARCVRAGELREVGELRVRVCDQHLALLEKWHRRGSARALLAAWKPSRSKS